EKNLLERTIKEGYRIHVFCVGSAFSNATLYIYISHWQSNIESNHSSNQIYTFMQYMHLTLDDKEIINNKAIILMKSGMGIKEQGKIMTTNLGQVQNATREYSTMSYLENFYPSIQHKLHIQSVRLCDNIIIIDIDSKNHSDNETCFLFIEQNNKATWKNVCTSNAMKVIKKIAQDIGRDIYHYLNTPGIIENFPKTLLNEPLQY
ncbi:hypothetical protein ACJX0J_024011, partial [Zea mays]